MLLCVAGSQWTQAQDPIIDREAKIKAAYLYQFIRYVQWPQSAFPEETSPIVIGSIGNDPVNPYLNAIARRRTAGNRKLVYRPVSSVSQAKSCHILFVSSNANGATVKSVVAKLRDTPVLLVGESPDFLRGGGVISFVAINNNIRLQLSTKSASNHGLRISSQLAKLAQIVN